MTQDCRILYRFTQKESVLEKSFSLNLTQLQDMRSTLQQLSLIQSYPEIQEHFHNLRAGVVSGGTGYIAAKAYTLFHRLSFILKRRFLVIVTFIEGSLGYAMERWDLLDKEEFLEEHPPAVKENELSFFISPQTEKALQTEIEELISKVREKECEEKTWPLSSVNQQYVNVFSLLTPNP